MLRSHESWQKMRQISHFAHCDNSMRVLDGWMWPLKWVHCDYTAPELLQLLKSRKTCYRDVRHFHNAKFWISIFFSLPKKNPRTHHAAKNPYTWDKKKNNEEEWTPRISSIITSSWMKITEVVAEWNWMIFILQKRCSTFYVTANEHEPRLEF